MPSGYTAEIYEGKTPTFEEFTLRCARAFGALMDMRDDSLDVPIPKSFEQSTYHKKRLEEVKKELEKAKKMTDEMADRDAEKSYKESLVDFESSLKKAMDLKKRYENMLRKVRAWQPPTSEHDGLKNFMIQQLIESIDHDCDIKFFKKQKPNKLSGSEWKKMRIDSCLRDVEYYTKHQKEEEESTNKKNEWIKSLRESLKIKR